LVEFILSMQEKPETIQDRPGFAQAVADAADRVLAGQATDKQQRIVIAAKLAALHRAAVAGDEAADKRLAEFVEKLRDDIREDVAREVRFFQTERAAMAAGQLPPEKIPAALVEIRQYLERETLTARHLRLASSVVEAINRMNDDDFREMRFQEFGRLFAKSASKELSRYGQRLADAPLGGLGTWIGKPLDLAGATVLGVPLDWASYRGKVVIVDFWASWCVPCREEFPSLQALHARQSPQGLDVVGVNLDKDADAMQKFLTENNFPWANLVGQEAFDVAKRLGVRGVPTMLLIDREGKVVTIGQTVAEMQSRAEALLAAK
jgi:thiol-disulfide isomerase/thioredoxin